MRNFGCHIDPCSGTFSVPSTQPLVAVCANQAWNLVNFRSGLIDDLLSSGYRVLAIAPPDAAMEQRLEELGCTFHPVAFDASGLSPWRDFGTFASLTRALLRHRPSAWLSWTIKPNIYGTMAASLLGIPAFPNVSGLGTAFIRRNFLTRAVKPMYRAAFRRASLVFFQNSEDRRLFVSERLVGSERARQLPGSGIDLSRFRPADTERPGRLRFLMVARVVADKGVREFVEAARLLRGKFPRAQFRLLGAVDVANRTAIAASEVRRWEEEGVIEHLPPTDDVRPAMVWADFVVLPSYREGLSRVLLEAGAMGRPIVTTDVPGCRDVVTDGENGYLCGPRDAAALAAALERAARTGDNEWRLMSVAGRKRVEREFSQALVSARYLNALRDAGIVPSPSIFGEPLPNA